MEAACCREAGNTLILMLTVPTLTLLICLAISWTVLRSGLRGRLLFDAVAFLPHARASSYSGDRRYVRDFVPFAQCCFRSMAA